MLQHAILSSNNIMNNKPTFRSRLLLLLRPHTMAIMFRKLRIYRHRIQLSDGLEMPLNKACIINGNHLRMHPLMSRL